MNKPLHLFLTTMLISGNIYCGYAEGREEITKLILNQEDASTENPVDMTSYIKNPAFDENTGTGWKGIGVINYHEVEFYQKTFDMYQEIEGLPAGKYRLKAQGFERPKSNDGGLAYSAGTEKIYAKLYAKGESFAEKTTPFKSLYQHTYTGAGNVKGYVNSMSAAEIMFGRSETNYLIELTDIILAEGEILRIGARNEFSQTGYWALFDNFKLEYLGQLNEEDLLLAIEDHKNEAESLKELKMQNSALISLTNAVNIATDALSGDDVDFEILSSLRQSLGDAVAQARLSNNAYTDLELALEESKEYLEVYTGTKLTNLQNAVEKARLLINNLDAEYSDLESSIKSINNIILKKIHIPTWMMGDVNNPENNWSMERSQQSKNWILFWEPGYGQDPRVVVDGNFRVDTDGLLNLAEECFYFYSDSLKFIKRGNSQTDNYKMIIRLRYTREWEASGSGVDDRIGLLTLTAWSGQAAGHTMAHEVGHCFQYQVHCDKGDQNGWMYGFGTNGSGGNCWWEQCAQWQAFKVFPSIQFTDYRYTNYLNTAHKHILHETPRYDNYFIQDFWTYKRGMDAIGRLWNESKYPQDPIQAYRSIFGITQSQFNDEMFECASRFATWDIPALKTAGANYFSARPQTKMTNIGDDFWQIDFDHCPENYGYNIIKLNAPSSAKTVTAVFEGKQGLTGYRKKSTTSAGWRFGFVALLKDGTRVYGDMGSASWREPSAIIDFECPDNCKNLWLVVTGAPSSHWLHPWDDDDSNDEQWPYQVKFNNTNLYGKANVTSIESVTGNNSKIDVYMVEKTLYINHENTEAKVSIVDITGRAIVNEDIIGGEYSKDLPSGIYIVTVKSGNETVSRKIITQ